MKKYIDAEGVMRVCYDGFIKTGAKAYREIFALLEAAPAEDVQEVRHGRWEEIEDRTGWSKNFFCSECRYEFFVDTCMLKPMWNYCPNCGAIMDKEEDE